MPVHPDLTAFRAVDACGGIYSAEEREERWAEGHKAALDAVSEAVKAADALTAELYDALKAILTTQGQRIHGRPTPDQWKAGLAAIAKAEARS